MIRRRPAAIAVAGMVLVLFAYYVWGVRRTDYAGQSFGTRHLLAISPACFYFAVLGAARLNSKLAWLGFALLMLVGACYGVAGLRDPWSRIEQRATTDPALHWLQKGFSTPGAAINGDEGREARSPWPVWPHQG